MNQIPITSTTTTTSIPSHRRAYVWDGQRLYGVLHLRVLALDAGLHERRVPNDEDAGRADYPEDGAERGREPEQRDADHEEAGVQRLLRHDVVADLHGLGGCRFAGREWVVVETGPEEGEETYRIC